MIVRPVHPVSGDPIETTDADARDRLSAIYEPPASDWLRINLITSIDGSSRGSDGTSETLSNPADRAILGVIRAQSDIVLVGAQTLRAEGTLLPKTARLAVLTAGGDLSGARVRDDVEPGRILVMGPARAEAAVRRTFSAPHEFVVLDTAPGAPPDGPVDVRVVVAALRERGLRRIVSEGGPRIAAQLLSAGLVDELCLSTSPQMIGGAGGPFGDAALPALPATLTSLLIDDSGGLYARWRLSRSA